MCGPGRSHPFYNARTRIRSYLETLENVTVVFGEDLLERKRQKKGDLQTVENEEADRSDFTILLVDSPGSIAELGCFSSSDFLRHRLFAVLPGEYYNSQSYIARGPLSILARQFQSSVIYFERTNLSALIKAVMVPVAMYKFIASEGNYYRPYLDAKLYKRNPDEYFQRYLKSRRRFLAAFTLAAMHISGHPTFIDLVSLLRISPRELNETLRELYNEASIRKRAGTYLPLKGYTDPVIGKLSSTAISVRRSVNLASRS